MPPSPLHRQDAVTDLADLAAFPELLRRHRIRAGLTQRALADLSTVSPRTIRDLEAGRANARTQTIHLLADGLRLQGPTRTLFVDASLSRRPAGPFDDHDAAPSQSADALIGRESEVRTLMAVLQSGHRRMIFVSGLPGVGKTRVVAEIATRLSTRRRWPVLWAGTDQRALPTRCGGSGPTTRPVIASNPADASRIRGIVGRRDALLVLDRIAGTTLPGEIEDLLRDCPGLRVMTTSRIPWRVPGGQAVVISSLDTPGTGCPPEDLDAVPSMRLLMDRLAEVRPGFRLDRADAEAAAELCRRLDGLPLALEAVARHGRVLSLRQLIEMPVPDLLRLSVPGSGAPASNGPGDAPATIDGLIRVAVDGLCAGHRALLRRLVHIDRPWTMTSLATTLHQSLNELLDGLDFLIGSGLLRAAHGDPASPIRVPSLVRHSFGGVRS
ncbi:AAA family ATPase [Micromonosporaceae bacterium Da 78-11]